LPIRPCRSSTDRLIRTASKASPVSQKNLCPRYRQPVFREIKTLLENIEINFTFIHLHTSPRMYDQFFELKPLKIGMSCNTSSGYLNLSSFIDNFGFIAGIVFSRKDSTWRITKHAALYLFPQPWERTAEFQFTVPHPMLYNALASRVKSAG